MYLPLPRPGISKIAKTTYQDIQLMYGQTKKIEGILAELSQSIISAPESAITYRRFSKNILGITGTMYNVFSVFILVFHYKNSRPL